MPETGAGRRSPVTANRHLAGVSGSCDHQARSGVGVAGLIALAPGSAEHLSRIGVGISSLVSLGDIDDVAGTDMLLWWESDPATKLALLYLESIANPPKFARTARRVGRSLPVLTVIAGRSITGRRLAGARAAAATPLLTRQALFEQAGVIARGDWRSCPPGERRGPLPGWCRVCPGIARVTGADVMPMSGDIPRGSLCTSDGVSHLIEELQYTLRPAQPRSQDGRKSRRIGNLQ